MNTGIQDAHNLAWKLALAVSGVPRPGCSTATTPNGGPSVRRSSAGPCAAPVRASAPIRPTPTTSSAARLSCSSTTRGQPDRRPHGAGRTRAPDATGLTRDAVAGSLRLFSLLGPAAHRPAVCAATDAGPADVERFERAADAAVAAAHGLLNVYLIAAPAADVATTVLPLIRDAGSETSPRRTRPAVDSVFVVRPDGYLGFTRAPTPISTALVAHLRATFGLAAVASPQSGVAGRPRTGESVRWRRCSPVDRLGQRARPVLGVDRRGLGHQPRSACWWSASLLARFTAVGTAVLAHHRRLLQGPREPPGVGLFAVLLLSVDPGVRARRAAQLLQQRPVLGAADRIPGRGIGRRGHQAVRCRRASGPRCWSSRSWPPSTSAGSCSTSSHAAVHHRWRVWLTDRLTGDWLDRPRLLPRPVHRRHRSTTPTSASSRTSTSSPPATGRHPTFRPTALDTSCCSAR